jgi:ribokinase
MTNPLKMSGQILCMGAINMDLVMFVLELPALGETVVTDNFSTFPGGKGGNQAVTAAVLGGQVNYFGKLGGDNFSDELLDGMSRRGVNTDYVLRDADSTAGIAMIWVDSKGRNSIVFSPGANRLLRPDEVPEYERCFTEGGILLITGEIRPDTIYAAVRQAKEKGMMVVMDPSPPPLPFPKDIPGLVDIVKPNENEAGLITGTRVTDVASAEQAARQLHDMGFVVPVVSLGEKGAVALIDGEIHHVNPIKVNAVDSTAAGDVFLGALVAALSKSQPLIDALKFANAAAALSTTKPGAQTSIPELSEVEALMA